MSRSLIRKIGFTVLGGFFLGAGGTHLAQKLSANDQLNSTGRGIASVKKEQPLFLGKHLSVVSVALRGAEEIPDSEDQELELTGYVRLNQPADSDVVYRWNLPEGTYIVSGYATDTWANMKPGQVASTKIVIRGFSKESLKLVGFHGFVKIGDNEFGNSAVMTSRPEDSLEMIGMNSAQGKVTR